MAWIMDSHCGRDKERVCTGKARLLRTGVYLSRDKGPGDTNGNRCQRSIRVISIDQRGSV